MILVRTTDTRRPCLTMRASAAISPSRTLPSMTVCRSTSTGNTFAPGPRFIFSKASSVAATSASQIIAPALTVPAGLSIFSVTGMRQTVRSAPRSTMVKSNP